MSLFVLFSLLLSLPPSRSPSFPSSLPPSHPPSIPSQVLTIWQNQEYFNETVLQEIQLVLTNGPTSFLPIASQSQVTTTAQQFHTLSISLLCSILLFSLLLVSHLLGSSSHPHSLLHYLPTCPRLLVECILGLHPLSHLLKGSPIPGRNHCPVTHSLHYDAILITSSL